MELATLTRTANGQGQVSSLTSTLPTYRSYMGLTFTLPFTAFHSPVSFDYFLAIHSLNRARKNIEVLVTFVIWKAIVRSLCLKSRINNYLVFYINYCINNSTACQ